LLGFELMEERRVLAPMADVVIVMDESGSGEGGGSNTWDWVKDRVFAATPGAVNPISQALAAEGFAEADVRYGLVGFGGSPANGGFAHSYIVNPNGPTGSDPLFGTAAQMDAALENFEFGIEGEDGWDAFEHVVAEYKFDENAVPVVVLLQNQEGRNFENTTLVREGILAALKSKNVLVNVLVYGSDLSGADSKIFDLTPYGGDPNVRILGVESDAADFVPDGLHDFVGINTSTLATVTTAGQTHSDALQVSYNGSNTGSIGMVGTGKGILFSKTATNGLGSWTAGYRATSVPMETVEFQTFASTGSSGVLITLPFTFTYYEDTFTHLRAWENGVITLGSANTDPGPDNADLSRTPVIGEPGRPTTPLIAPLWDNLRAPNSPQIKYKTLDLDGDFQTDDALAIEWFSYGYGDGFVDGRDLIHFQAVLYADGRIRFDYQDLDKRAAGGPPVTGGISATVGLWSGSADVVAVPASKYAPGLQSLFGSINDEEAPPPPPSA
jgi:hypothetical protein